MKITEVQIRMITDGGCLKAVASITINDEFVVHDLRIIEAFSNKFFVGMPSKKTPDGRFEDIAHPATIEAHMAIQDAVLTEYYRVLDKAE